MSGDDIEFTNSKIYNLVDEFYTLGGRIVVIDEVHKYKNWAQEVKNIYDSFPDLTIRISGSSMLNILYEKYDLSRRLVIHTMPVLSFKEYFEITKNIKLDSYTFEEILTNSSAISKELVFAHEELYACFKDYLKYGAYPFYLEGLESFNQKLYNALDKIIHEDIPSLNKIDYSHISIFEKLIFFVVSSNKPFSINVASLAREFGVSEPTLYTYLDILDNTSIFKSMRKKSQKISKKPQKLLFSNTNILYAYANKINLELDIGVVRETYFVNCFKNIYYSDIGDFIVENKIFEVGGKNKSFSQVKDLENSYLAIDIDFTSNDKKIPLWLFSFIKTA
jgi:predicted AAA+ superfamily ATPase